MTTVEAARLVGARAMFTGDECMVFTVLVRDVKQAYGSMRFLVTPESGAGERWVDGCKVKFYEGDL